MIPQWQKIVQPPVDDDDDEDEDEADSSYIEDLPLPSKFHIFHGDENQLNVYPASSLFSPNNIYCTQSVGMQQTKQLCIHRYIHIYIHRWLHTYIHTYMHTYLHTKMHTYKHIYRCIHINIHRCIHINIYTYLYTYNIDIYIHINTRTYLNAYTPRWLPHRCDGADNVDVFHRTRRRYKHIHSNLSKIITHAYIWIQETLICTININR